MLAVFIFNIIMRWCVGVCWYYDSSILNSENWVLFCSIGYRVYHHLDIFIQMRFVGTLAVQTAFVDLAVSGVMTGAAYTVIASISLSRVGLWSFDLCEREVCPFIQGLQIVNITP